MTSEREPQDATDDTPEEQRARARHEGVARGEQLQHSGVLDLVAVVVLAASLYVADSSDQDLGPAYFLLATALWIFGIRAFLRLCVYFKTT